MTHTPEPFELEWMGGPTEHYFHRVRPGLDDLPWGTVRIDDYPPTLVAAARGIWTDLVITEYRAVAAFAQIVNALIAAKAPLDMIGMASNFVADEVSHVELASRMAMELGGAAPRQLDVRNFGLRATPGLDPFQQANEWMVQICCVSEAYASGSALTVYRSAEHPLAKNIFAHILRDESHHHRLGPLYLEWAGERFDDAERKRLSLKVLETLSMLSRLWKRRVGEVTDGRTEEGWPVSQLHELGCLESRVLVPRAHQVVRTHVLAPLAQWGIGLTEEQEISLGLPPRASAG